MAFGKLLYSYSGSLLAIIAFSIYAIYLLFVVAGLGDVQIAQLLQSTIFIISLLSLVTLLPIIVTIYARKANKAPLQNYINLSVLRYVLAFLMFFYGLSKMSGKFFEITFASLDTRLEDVDSFALTWFYFGKSNVQEFVIGLLEVIPAVLLLFRRTFFLGTILLLPVAANVFMINVFNNIAGITRIVSFFVMIATFYFLVGWFPQITYFFKNISTSKDLEFGKSLKLLIVFAKLFLVGIMLFVSISTAISNMQSRNANLNRNKITGGFQLESLMVDDREIDLLLTETDFYKTIYLEPQLRWNTVLMMDKKSSSKALMIDWMKGDSVVTFIKRSHDVADNRVDSISVFKGTYSIKSNRLYVDGWQCGSTIHAVYTKKNLTEYSWFW